MDQWHGVFLASALIFAVAAILFWQRWCDEAATAKKDSAEHLETREALADFRQQANELEDVVEVNLARIRELEIEAASWEKAAQESADRNQGLKNELFRSNRIVREAEARAKQAENDLVTTNTRHRNELALETNKLRDAEENCQTMGNGIVALNQQLHSAEQERDRLASALVGMIAASKHAQAHLDALKTPMQETSDTERFVMSKPKCLRTSAPCEDYASVNEFLNPGEADRKDA